MRKAPNAIFKSLSDPTRRALFERLSRDGEQTVRILTGHSGVSQPAISKHLRILRLAGLVRARRGGRETHYRARPQALGPLMAWMGYYSRFWVPGAIAFVASEKPARPGRGSLHKSIGASNESPD